MKRNINDDFNKNSINFDEQRRLLLDMLLYFDNICRENGIKYSLIGGSLIGAVRHNGFIPWDDDIDIILDKDNYKKLIPILKRDNNNDYRLLIPLETPNYPLQFAKLVNNNTSLVEYSMIDSIDNYGLFIDIFVYNNLPNDLKIRNKHYKKSHYYRNSLVRVKLDYRNVSFLKKTRRIIKNLYLTIFGYKNHLKKLLKLYSLYNDSDTEYVMSNNPTYGAKKETQKASDIKEYIDVDFEGHKIMIFKNYDNILKTTYGDYMKIPPEDKRVTHNLEVYWKNKD